MAPLSTASFTSTACFTKQPRHRRTWTWIPRRGTTRPSPAAWRIISGQLAPSSSVTNPHWASERVSQTDGTAINQEIGREEAAAKIWKWMTSNGSLDVFNWFIFQFSRCLSEPLMTFKLHKEFIMAVSKFVGQKEQQISVPFEAYQKARKNQLFIYKHFFYLLHNMSF